MIRDLQFPNSAWVRAPERFVLRDGRLGLMSIPVRYGTFTHPEAGHCLIDTGYTRRVTKGRRSLPLNIYNAVLRPRLTRHALPDAKPLVDTIILTHLHADHVAGLKDYPQARIITDRAALMHFLEPGASRLRHGVFRELLPEDIIDRVTDFSEFAAIECPYGLGPGRDLLGDGSVVALPLPGHMRGHTGICFPDETRPLLYAVDAQWLHRAVMENRLPGAPARWILDDVEACQRSADRIRQFCEAGGRVVYCHDPASPVSTEEGNGTA
ncbi:MBL fold metallo-hydrolase [Maricaulis alexandrii]|uniref:MBL fold metallo-hydrolase n=1 Tax=Maricaulis alexandrii TaxID=2570354 RepID=UPI0014869801|nr:MBL fold metallo-hydrolase [Maricaulis alexandrii]